VSAQSRPARISPGHLLAGGWAINNSNAWNASRSMAAYFFRSSPNHPCQSAKARTRSFGTADSLVRGSSATMVCSSWVELLAAVLCDHN